MTALAPRKYMAELLPGSDHQMPTNPTDKKPDELPRPNMRTMLTESASRADREIDAQNATTQQIA